MINKEYVDELMHRSIKDYENMNARQYRATVAVLCSELIRLYEEVDKLKKELGLDMVKA